MMQKLQTEVLVIGGGMAGVGAAISAGRMGAKTLLVENYGCLGGTGTSGMVNNFCGYSSSSPGAFQIVKGIGEINKDDFWDKVLCPEAREKTFIRVNYDNIDEVINKCFEDYMGENTQPRKEFVSKFITKVNLEEIN
jgi:glycine/D-amino acid oxidase-like deaminating enzyme